jgi:hypothetical protein
MAGPIRPPFHPQGRPRAEAFQVAACYVLDVRQALGVVRGRLEHEQFARTGQLALAVMDGDHTRPVGSQFRGRLVAEVTDELSDEAVWCRGGDFRARVEHAASV